MMAKTFRAAITAHDSAELLSIRRGIEKEGLRVSSENHALSKKPHPTSLGSALTHRSITTDYSEALLEFITGVHQSPNAVLTELFDLHAYTARSLPDEIMWGGSMPGELGPDSDIPIAHYGSSNIGKMKRIYRNGLGARYGRRMQVIAGIHYNFSLPEAFWERTQSSAGNTALLQDWRTEGYLAIIRNFQRYGWLLNFLTGSSPALNRTFVLGEPPEHLTNHGPDTLIGEFATSLRMGDLGYTSSAQDGLQICYNQIDTYIKTLTDAIVTPHGPYQALPQNQNEEQLQLNHGLLQIENEFYSAIRPKRITESGEAPVRALSNRGIEYLEIRCLDINPFTPLGIDDNTIALVDTFLLACALTDSPLCDADSRAMDSVNTQRVLNAGRDPKLQLLTAEGSAVPLTELALPIIDMMHEAAVWLDGSEKTDRHTYAVEHAVGILTGDAESPSARVIRELKDRQVSYSTLIGDYSQTWNDAFKRQAPSQQVNAALADEAIASLRRQREVEASDTVPFSTFLRQFYAQYE